jgi:hypothetical protein
VGVITKTLPDALLILFPSKVQVPLEEKLQFLKLPIAGYIVNPGGGAVCGDLPYPNDPDIDPIIGMYYPNVET